MRLDRDRNSNSPVGQAFRISRRALLQSAFAVGGLAGVAGASARDAFAGETAQDDGRPKPASSAIGLARILNRTRFSDLPPLAVEHAKIIIASTLASAASGSAIESARIIRELAKERGGKPEAPVWFDGARIPVSEAARVNATLSDAAASDDSDIRNTAHAGTTLAATGLAIAERTGATGQDVLGAIVTGYEAAGRIGDARRGGLPGIHASQIVAFGGAVAASRLLKQTDEQMAHAMGLVAITMGGLAIGTNSWAREYMGGNAALTGVNAALAAGRGFTVNEDILEASGGFLAIFGRSGSNVAERLTRPIDEWDIVKYLAIKLWPGAHPFSSLLEAAVTVARQAYVPPDDVIKILVSGQDRTVTGSRNPKDLVEAIHSLPYFLASAVADKDFSWIHATEAKIHNPAVRRLMPLVEVDPSPPSVRYDWSWGGTVTIVTRSGGRFSSTVDAPRGSAPRGIEWGDVEAKYRALMPQSRLPASRIEQTLDLVHRFDQVTRVSELTALLKAS